MLMALLPAIFPAPETGCYNGGACQCEETSCKVAGGVFVSYSSDGVRWSRPESLLEARGVLAVRTPDHPIGVLQPRGDGPTSIYVLRNVDISERPEARDDIPSSRKGGGRFNAGMVRCPNVCNWTARPRPFVCRYDFPPLVSVHESHHITASADVSDDSELQRPQHTTDSDKVSDDAKAKHGHRLASKRATDDVKLQVKHGLHRHASGSCTPDAQSCEMPCSDRVVSCGSSIDSASAAADGGTPFDGQEAFVFDPGSEWQERAVCAKHGAVAHARRANLSFNAIGIAWDRRSNADAARALLRTGRLKDCAATEVVLERIESMLVRRRASSGSRDSWLRHLFANGYARIDGSWGFAPILHETELAGRLRVLLDAQQTIQADEGPEGKQSGVKAIQADHGETHRMMRNVTRTLMERLRPAAEAYLGADAGPGRARLVLLEGKPIASLWYPSGMWHHDRCGPRLKCFVNLGEVGPAAHPMRIVPRSHTTVYYAYDTPVQSRFSDAYIEANYDPPVVLVGSMGEGFCFDTNGLHSGTLQGTQPRYVAIFEFHSEGQEQAFTDKGVHAPFGE